MPTGVDDDGSGDNGHGSDDIYSDPNEDSNVGSQIPDDDAIWDDGSQVIPYYDGDRDKSQVIPEFIEVEDEEQESTRFRSPGCGDKHPQSSTGSLDVRRKATKVHATAGNRTKASDYGVDVQKILHVTNACFCAHLGTLSPYPSPFLEIKWAKIS